jgi:uncharacterized membrane protein
LGLVVALVVVTNLFVLTPAATLSPLRIVFGVIFVLLIPGYAFIAALFPEAETRKSSADQSDTSPEADQEGGISGIGRALFSVGSSIVIVSLLGVLLDTTPWRIRPAPIVVSVSGVTLLCTAVAVVRRRALPPEDRFTVPFKQWATSIRSGLFSPQSRIDAILNIVLIASLVLSALSIGFVLTAPIQEDPSSEFYLLSEAADGELRAENYPRNFTLGESKQLTVGITNHEQRTTEYTVVVQLQEVRSSNQSLTVVTRDELTRFNTRVASGENWRKTHSVTPSIVGDRLRLVYLLYKDNPLDDPRIETAYRSVHIWISVD